MNPPDSEALPGSLPLELEQHEAFCQSVSFGRPAGLAYRETIARKCTMQSSWASASTLMRDPKFSLRVRFLRAEAAKVVLEKFGLDTETMVAMQLEIVTTPVGEIDQNHYLAQRVRRKRLITGRTEADVQEWEVEEIEMPSKGGALKALADLGGHNAAQKIEQTTKHETSADDLLSNPSGCHAVGRLLAMVAPECAEAMLAGLQGREISPKPTP